MQFLHIIDNVIDWPACMVSVLFYVHFEICFSNVSINIWRWECLIKESFHFVTDGNRGDDAVVSRRVVVRIDGCAIYRHFVLMRVGLLRLVVVAGAGGKTCGE